MVAIRLFFVHQTGSAETLRCNRIFKMPQNGQMKLYKELKCPLDNFELPGANGHDFEFRQECSFTYIHVAVCSAGTKARTSLAVVGSEVSPMSITPLL